MVENVLTNFISFKYDFLLSELNYWMNNLWKVLDEALIEIAEVNEKLHLSEIIECRSINDCLHLNWSRQVEYLSLSRVFNLSRLDSNQNSWLKYLSWIKRFNSSIQIKSAGWDRVLTRNFRFDSLRHEAKYY